MSKKRFIGPVFMFLVGALVAIQLILLITVEFPNTQVPDIMSAPLGMAPSLGFDILTILAFAYPILFLEYYLLAVPVALLILFVTKVVKSARYELNIMNIGKNFHGTQMIRRAATPALFSVASAQMLRDPLKMYIFNTTDVASLVAVEIQPLVPIVVSLMSSLVFMPISLLLFMPTWVLNDAGVVTHLKSDDMDLRQCPDTQGVGRWIANMLGGYALLAFPITMFIAHFYDPIIVPLLQDPLAITPDVIFYDTVVGLLWTIGLPFFVMAFILPIIMFNEKMQDRSTISILKWANKLGARIIRKERIKEIKRPTMIGDIDSSANVELWAKATIGEEVVMSSKRVKKEKTKKKTKTKSSKTVQKSKGRPRTKKKKSKSKTKSGKKK